MSKKHYPTVERNGSSVTVTAHSTVEAQQIASQELGTECTITHVEKVQEGGIGGFFATELVRITARPSHAHAASRAMDDVLVSADDLMSSLRANSPEFADRLLAEWREADELATATASSTPRANAMAGLHEAGIYGPDGVVTPDPLRSVTPVASSWSPDDMPTAHEAPRPAVPLEIAPIAPIVPAATPAPVEFVAPAAPDPVIDALGHLVAEVAVVPPPAVRASMPVRPVQSAPGAGAPWSANALRALGVPDRVVDAAEALLPETEGQWIVALMTVLGDYCGPISTASSVMVGPSAANLSRQLKLVSVTPEELGETVTSVAVPHVSTKTLASGIGARDVHLVVGGAWEHLVGTPVHVVSASTEWDLVVALRVAVAWAATLGWYWSGMRYVRIDEFAIVEQIRTALREGEGMASR